MKMDSEIRNSLKRKDVLVETELSTMEELASCIASYKNTPLSFDNNQERQKIRYASIEKNDSDPNGYERVVGRSDFVSTNFLAR